jgi:hypothetical protein
MLAVSRWLSTAQVHACSFPGVTIRVLHRRLRLLRTEGYIHSVRAHPMAEALHALGPKGRSELLERGWQRPMTTERSAPRNLEHFLGINDIRIAVERSAGKDPLVAIRFFYACWELQQRGWAYAVIPDAALRVERAGRSATVLFEYDRNQESAEYVFRTKFQRYDQGLDGFPFSQVVTVVDSVNRLEQLREYTARRLPGSDKFVFLTRQAILETWSASALFD